MLHLLESEAILSELPLSSSSSSSSDYSNSDEDTDSSSSSSNKSFDQFLEDEIFLIEDMIMHLCILYNISRNLVDDVILELFNYTALTREELESVGTEYEPKKNERFQDVPDKTLYKWTRFTSHQLFQLKSFFFEGAESEIIEIVHRDNTKSRWTIEHVMLIALTYQSTGESYLSMVMKLGD